MELMCSYCGKPFACYDNYVRRYCPECQGSGKRHAAQFKERRNSDPVVDIYASQYGKRHTLYRNGKMTKDALDEWRHQVRIRRHELSTGKITVEDFRVWCDETLKLTKASIKTEVPQAAKRATGIISIKQQ